ncbi:hypothetical protein SS50377_22971 [Spironucleus salmonicida]|uniref:Uncharacterized protein n=1 Tax=Spironucleus salmonicida TaxID=348837 RepID=V6LUP8_9EUKA|nr:hypothetical protein SS50377_22971 [Spironucleus salmonicida]|eukprot:EST47983.1 hypothetical protein SS50377_11897 [Spironucleus salmonicida]
MSAQPDLKRQLAQERVATQLATHRNALQTLAASDASAAQLNRSRVQQLFKQQIQQQKRPQMLKFLEEISNDFQRAFDRKDALLSLTNRYTELAENQRKKAISAHQQTLNELNFTLNDRMTTFTNDAENDISRLDQQFQTELSALKNVYDIRKTALGQMQFATEEVQSQLLSNLRSNYAARLLEAKNYNQEQCNICKLNLEEQNTELERHLLESHENYKLQTETKQHQFKILLLKDQQSSHAIERQKARIERLSKLLIHWRAKIQSTSEEFKGKNLLLLQEKEECYKEFSELKGKLNRYRNGEQERMKTLVSAAHEAEDKIQALKEQADRIIRLSELCGRLETEAERVNEVERLDVEQRREIEREAAEMHSRQETLRSAVKPGEIDPNQQIEAEVEIIDAVKELNHVHKKLSNATIDRLALQKEQSLLERENRELREALQRYLSLGTMAQNAM